jgi:hypothetical protein
MGPRRSLRVAAATAVVPSNSTPVPARGGTKRGRASARKVGILLQLVIEQRIGRYSVVDFSAT